VGRAALVKPMDSKAFTRSDGPPPRPPVAFAERLAGSEGFKAMFREGMALVEETAGYLDGEGRKQSRLLQRTPSLAYATESMRLTTRLMQLASWLLLQRAVNNGDMTPSEASRERAKVSLGVLATSTEGPGWESLPERLRGLIRRSLSLQQRVMLLNEALTRPPAEADRTPNAVQRDLSRLAAAFAGK
jgi:regulator of CtrA degradation